MLVKQELTMNLSMKCFPPQKRNYDIETLIPKMPNAAEKKSLFINFLIQIRLIHHANINSKSIEYQDWRKMVVYVHGLTGMKM